MITGRTGLILVGHGSRVPESMGIYEEIARKVASLSDYEVEVGYMKHGRPTITEALKGHIEKGLKRIVVVPLFLLPGLHVQEDIPILLGLREGESDEFDGAPVAVPEDVEIIYANHIGADPRLAEVVLDRVIEVI